MGYVMSLSHRAKHDSGLATARNALGEEAFATAWVQGHAMALDQAGAYALKEATPA